MQVSSHKPNILAAFFKMSIEVYSNSKYVIVFQLIYSIKKNEDLKHGKIEFA